LHAGILIAQEKGWYDSVGLHFHWFTTEIDSYQQKPIWRVQDGEADLAIGPSEHIYHYSALHKGAPKIRAIGTILQEDMSAFITKASSGIDRPKKLDGQTYVGYNTPMEQEILTTMIENDGGEGNFDMITPPRLSVWNAFLADSGEVAWVFLNWEAAKLKDRGVDYYAFKPQEYGVPYGYSSVFFAPENPTQMQERMYRKFLQASAKGYRWVAQHPKQSADILLKTIDHPNFSDTSFVHTAMRMIAPAFTGAHGWGQMKSAKFEAFTNWMAKNNLLHWHEGGQATRKDVKVETLYTNRFLEGKK
jgi:NitT/TauT family transport system substrate-binding protein